MTSYELTHLKKMVRMWKTKSVLFLFKMWPTYRFSKSKSYNFHFHKNYVTSLLVQMVYFTLDNSNHVLRH